MAIERALPKMQCLPGGMPHTISKRRGCSTFFLLSGRHFIEYFLRTRAKPKVAVSRELQMCSEILLSRPLEPKEAKLGSATSSLFCLGFSPRLLGCGFFVLPLHCPAPAHTSTTPNQAHTLFKPSPAFKPRGTIAPRGRGIGLLKP